MLISQDKNQSETRGLEFHATFLREFERYKSMNYHFWLPDSALVGNLIKIISHSNQPWHAHDTDAADPEGQFDLLYKRFSPTT